MFQEQFPQSSRLTNLHLEVVEGMLVDVFHLLPKSHGIVCQSQDVRAAFFVIGGVIEAGGGHVGRANGFDFLQLTKPLFTDDLESTAMKRSVHQESVFQIIVTSTVKSEKLWRMKFHFLHLSCINDSRFYLIKISDDLIKQPQTLHPLVVGFQLHVKLREVADGCKHDSNALARLVI